MKKRIVLFALLGVLLAFSLASPAFADDFHGHGHGDWHGDHDIHRFHDHDFDYWRAGNWFHGFHHGRHGWWWIVDGRWYFYTAPIYPYPNPYVPPAIIVEQPIAPTVVPSGYYYCVNPQGYYPYVAECAQPWQKVLANGAVEAVPPLSPPSPPPVVIQEPPPQPFSSVDLPALTTRQQDDRKLDGFGSEFAAMDVSDTRTVKKLKNLQARVEAYRQSLFDRDYNAMDLLRDTEKLQHQIADKLEAMRH